MWSLCLYGRQSRKKYLYKTFDILPQPQCITEAQNIFSEFQTRVPWGEDLDLFLSNEDNVGCIRSFNHLWRWQVGSKVEAQYNLIK